MHRYFSLSPLHDPSLLLHETAHHRGSSVYLSLAIKACTIDRSGTCQLRWKMFPFVSCGNKFNQI